VIMWEFSRFEIVQVIENNYYNIHNTLLFVNHLS